MWISGERGSGSAEVPVGDVEIEVEVEYDLDNCPIPGRPGPLMPTSDTPGTYGGWTNLTVMWDPIAVLELLRALAPLVPQFAEAAHPVGGGHSRAGDRHN